MIDQLILERVLGLKNPNAEKNKRNHQIGMVSAEFASDRFKQTFLEGDRVKHALKRMDTKREKYKKKYTMRNAQSSNVQIDHHLL